MSGETVVLHPAVRLNDRVEELRRRIAAQLGVHVFLLCESRELKDGQVLRQVLPRAGAAHFSVIKSPCKIAPDEYEAHIDRGAVGLLAADRIRTEFGHPLVYPEEPPRLSALQILLETRAQHQQRERQRWQGTPDPGWGRRRNLRVEFPEPQGIRINMMPFVLGEAASVPQSYRHYWPLIESCELSREEMGRVGYLTIHESLVPAGEPQRRGGIHIESPGSMRMPGEYQENRIDWGCGIVRADLSKVEGGIWMASNVPRSCRAWNVRIRDPEVVVGSLGSLEHLREILGEGTFMEAGKLYWLTDVTPHESLPMERETYRQYFRLVTSALSAWYPEHSTANPLVTPDTSVTKTFWGNKFESEMP